MTNLTRPPPQTPVFDQCLVKLGQISTHSYMIIARTCNLFLCSSECTRPGNRTSWLRDNRYAASSVGLDLCYLITAAADDQSYHIIRNWILLCCQLRSIHYNYNILPLVLVFQRLARPITTELG